MKAKYVKYWKQLEPGGEVRMPMKDETQVLRARSSLNAYIKDHGWTVRTRQSVDVGGLVLLVHRYT